MNVLVTGGVGYIGSICTEELLDAGHQVTVYDNLTEGHRSAVDARAAFVLGKPDEPGDILNAVTRFMDWNSSRSATSTPPARVKNSANITALKRT